MTNPIIRLLQAEEIECRVSFINEKGLSLLLYKDARVDQKILDETFGVFGWKRTHQEIDGNLYCTVEVYNQETGEWVGKQDVGTTGEREKEKSQASDSFKRACFNWGIGRELYSAPFIWIPAQKAGIYQKDKKFITSEHFSVVAISYNEERREISSLSITNQTGEVIYRFQKASNKQEKETVSVAKKLSDAQKQQLELELARTGVPMEAVQQRYQVKSPEEMTNELYQRIMKALANTKTKQVA